MYCTKCGNQIVTTDNYCEKCGKPLTSINKIEGDGSINIAGNNIITNSPIHIGSIYKSEDFKEEAAYIDRTYVKPITLAGSPVKSSWLIISGIVGFVGSLASVFSVIDRSWGGLLFIVTVISMILLFTGINLWRTRFSRLKWFNFESNSDGYVFLTKITGKCPKCNGTLKLVDLKVTSDRSKTFVRCSRNGDHIWNFDPTVLD